MIPQDLAYDFPAAAYLLSFVPLLGILSWSLYSYREKRLSSLADASILSHILIPRSALIYTLKTLALLGGWAFATAALMQPRGNAHYPEENLIPGQPYKPETKEAEAKMRLRGHEVIFLVDASASMSVPDSRSGIMRLEDAKDIVDQIISRLDGESASLYAFTSAVTQMSPSTMDYLFLRLAARQIEINEGDTPGTNIVEALAETRKRYFSTPSPKLKTLILLSDGGDTAIESAQGEMRQKEIDEMLNLLDNAEAMNLRVYTIGLGSLQGADIPKLTYEGKSVSSKLEEEVLARLAKRGRGSYYRSNDYTTLEIAKDVIASLRHDPPFLEEKTVLTPLSEGGGKVYDLYFQVPLGAAIILLLYVVFWPDVKGSVRVRAGHLAATALSFFFAAALHADIDGKLKQAALDVEGEAFEQAEGVYEGLLMGELPAWQKAVVSYNLGTAFLEAGNYGKAIETFKQIPPVANYNPLLMRNVQTNLAFALVQSAETSQENTWDNFDRTLFRFREAMDLLKEAVNSDCTVQKAEGSMVCKPPKDLLALLSYTKIHFAQTLSGLMQVKMKQASLKEGLPFLSKSMQQLIENVKLLDNKNLQGEVRKQYESRAVEVQTEWVPLWESIQQRMAQQPKVQMELFQKAKDEFDHGIALVEGRKAAEAIKVWNNALEVLNELMRQSLGHDPAEIILRKLQAYYQYVELQVHLQISTLLSLQAEQEQVSALLPDALKQSLAQAQKNLSQSLEALSTSHGALAKFYFEQAHQIIRQLLRKAAPSSTNPPMTLLEEMIEDQQHALRLHRLLVLSDPAERDSSALQQVVNEAQGQVINVSKPFLATVFDWQEKAYLKDGCQADPWGEVLPLYDQGRQAAVNAVAAADPESVELKGEALQFWREALDKIKKLKSASTGSCKGSKNKNEQRKGGEGKTQEEKTPIDEVLRQLLEMDQDDRIKRPQPALQLPGFKPW